ncbi:MAG TPA: substrate-binding domain-containing protein [Tepidisphaeraceae bacterium]|nr:substrate-binding domain-containing protein [Tepidisphaeraceae bacterium]
MIVDGVSSYGRAVLRGVMRYANLQRRWELHEDIWRAAESRQYFPRCDGAILAGATTDVFNRVRRKCPHIIFCSGSANPDRSPVIALDDEAAGEMAAQHLLDRRLEHFGFYGTSPIVQNVANKRFAGFRKALAQHGHKCQASPVHWPEGLTWMTHAHRPQLIKWLHALPKPIGIFTADDAVAHDLAASCLDAGIGVPEHVAIVGVNNDDLLCESAWPPLSSVEADYSRMGYLAARMLDQILSGKSISKKDRYILLAPLGVVQRQSTDVLALNDVDVAEAIRYIREHACDPCGVPDVLRHVPVGRRWLERQFQRTLGRTPHDEIIRVRIDAARRLLNQPEISLDEIAARCGFSAYQNFIRTFRNVTSITPAAYRRTALQGVRPGAADRVS